MCAMFPDTSTIIIMTMAGRIATAITAADTGPARAPDVYVILGPMNRFGCQDY